jgi:hypothetical protein
MLTSTLIADDLARKTTGGDAETALIDHALLAGVSTTERLLTFTDELADTLETHHEDNDVARDLLDVLEAWEDDPDAALADIHLVDVLAA